MIVLLIVSLIVLLIVLLILLLVALFVVIPTILLIVLLIVSLSRLDLKRNNCKVRVHKLISLNLTCSTFKSTHVYGWNNALLSKGSSKKGSELHCVLLWLFSNFLIAVLP